MEDKLKYAFKNETDGNGNFLISSEEYETFKKAMKIAKKEKRQTDLGEWETWNFGGYDKGK